MKSPTISVIMATYNNAKYISKTVESILNQSFTDFEFIIINDCSKDNTLKILSRFDDKRINIINNKKNLGLYKSLNVGFNSSSGDFIARIDADDIAFPNRLQVQYDYLKSNPSLGFCHWLRFECHGRLE